MMAGRWLVIGLLAVSLATGCGGDDGERRLLDHRLGRRGLLGDHDLERIDHVHG